jgi:hypothetical protein
MEFDDLTHINSIRVYSLNHHPTHRSNNHPEMLRFITTSAGLPDHLFLNRGYRRVELINTNSWKVRRGWSKQDLDYGELNEIRLITCSFDGSYVAMNIRWNDRVRFIDLRKNDDQMNLIKSIRMTDDSLPLRLRIQVPFAPEQWLVIDEKNQCYKVSADPHDQKIIPMRTDHMQAMEYLPAHFRFVRDHKYLLVGAVIGNSTRKHGVFNFYKLSAS